MSQPRRFIQFCCFLFFPFSIWAHAEQVSLDRGLPDFQIRERSQGREVALANLYLQFADVVRILLTATVIDTKEPDATRAEAWLNSFKNNPAAWTRLVAAVQDRFLKVPAEDELLEAAKMAEVVGANRLALDLYTRAVDQKNDPQTKVVAWEFVAASWFQMPPRIKSLAQTWIGELEPSTWLQLSKEPKRILECIDKNNAVLLGDICLRSASIIKQFPEALNNHRIKDFFSSVCRRLPKESIPVVNNDVPANLETLTNCLLKGAKAQGNRAKDDSAWLFSSWNVLYTKLGLHSCQSYQSALWEWLESCSKSYTPGFLRDWPPSPEATTPGEVLLKTAVESGDWEAIKNRILPHLDELSAAQVRLLMEVVRGNASNRAEFFNQILPITDPETLPKPRLGNTVLRALVKLRPQKDVSMIELAKAIEHRRLWPQGNGKFSLINWGNSMYSRYEFLEIQVPRREWYDSQVLLDPNDSVLLLERALWQHKVDQAQGNKLLIELPAQYPLRFNDVFEKIWLACKPEERLGYLGKVVEALAEAPPSHFSKGGMEFVINNLTNFITLHPHPLETAVQLSARLHEIVDTEPRKSAVSVYERAATLEGYWGLKLKLAPQSDFSSLMDEGLPLCLEMLKLNTEAQQMSALSYAIADDAPTDLNLLVLYHAMTKADQNAALTMLQPWLESLAEKPKEQVLQSIEIRYGDQDLVLPKCIRFLQGDQMDANECPIRFTHLRKIEAAGSLNLPWAEIRKKLPRLRPEKAP